MNKFRFVLIMLIAAICGDMNAQSQEHFAELMRERGEYYFKVNVGDPSEVQTINRICSVDGIDGMSVMCYANSKQYEAMLRAGYQPSLMTPPSMKQEAKMWDGGDRATYEWDSYLTYEQYVAMMESFPSAALSGRNCTLLDLGTLSSTGRKILGVRLNNGQTEGKPKFLYTSTMHGDEVTGMILMLRLINEFCTSTDTRITNLLNNLDIFIFPLTNPDGTYYGGNNTVNGARRYNGNNVDLNRNFPDFDDGSHPDGESYQEETQWMMELAQEHLFTMAANYHGGSEVLNYPWDTYQPVHPDDAWWQYVCLRYAQSAQSVNSSYMTNTSSNGIINGYAWYTITGSRQDYMNYYAQCREITVECSNSKTPSASLLPNFWNYNHDGMLIYMEECLNGVHGFVYDAVSKAPLEGVTVKVQDHDHHGSQVSTHAIGDFHRPIKGGTYTFVFSKSGYSSQSVQVTITDGQRIDLDPIYMEEGEDPVPDSFNMQDGSFTTCDATFYDSGGSEGNYGNDQDYILTLYPASEGAMIKVTFNSFQIENSYDNFYIFDGASTAATLIGQYTGSNSPGTIIATNPEGALTFEFVSDYSVNKVGWDASVSCYYPSFEIEATADPTAGGSIEGAGTFNAGETCTLTATAADGYQFVNWTEDNSVVATEESYSFIVSGNRNLTAHFETIPLHWTANTSSHADNFTMNAIIQIDGEEQFVNTLEVGVFVNDECRGSAMPMLFPYNNRHILCLVIVGEIGENFSFRLYDHTTDTELTPGLSAPAPVSFNTDGYGSPINPYVLNFTSSSSLQQITLNEGWNWFSSYIRYDENSLGDIQSQITDAGANSMIKSQNQSTSNVDGTWTGILTSLDNTSMYLILSDQVITITLSGEPVDPSTLPITLNPGWNWISFPLEQALDVAAALSGITPSENDIIKGQDASASFIDGTWQGMLQVLEPGKGYLYLSNNLQNIQLVFPK